MSWLRRNRNRPTGPGAPTEESQIPESRPPEADGPTGDADDPIHTTITTPEDDPVHVTTPADQPIEVTTPEDDPIQAEVAIGGSEDAPPVKVELSGEVDINLKGTAGAPSEGTNGGGASAATFEVRIQGESGLDGNNSINVEAVDRTTGRRVTVADVRQRYGDYLDLTNKHRPFVRGEVKSDTYTPEPGEVLTWKEDAKTRG